MVNDEYFMEQALFLAKTAKANNEVPVGAVLVKENIVIGEGSNRSISLSDPTAHAEIIALHNVAQRCGNYRLIDTTLYVTLEPCAMCVGALIHARIKRLVFGAFSYRAGAVASIFQLLNEPRLNHRVLWTGSILAEPCANLLTSFFQAARRSK